MSTETRDWIAEQLAAEAGPGMSDLYEVDEATRRLFVERADRVRRFIAAELRSLAPTLADRGSSADALRLRADHLDPDGAESCRCGHPSRRGYTHRVGSPCIRH